MEYASKDLSEFEGITNELVNIKQQDEYLMECLLQISRRIQRAASSQLPVPRLLPVETFICKHGHINCLRLYGNKENPMDERIDNPSQHLSESLKNLQEITSSIEDMTNTSSSDHDSDY